MPETGIEVRDGEARLGEKVYESDSFGDVVREALRRDLVPED